MRFQCTFCFTIIPAGEELAGRRLACPNCGKSLAVPRSRFEMGSVIADFVIEGVIGEGGMSTVYQARQLSMDRRVALKILSSRYLADEKYQRLFLKEAKAAARLNHPNIIQAVAVGLADGVLYYAMEYVKGKTLAQRITQERSIELDEALNIVQQVAEALHLAWTQEQLIHRDIKPDNIMLAEDGLAKVMDLGIAVTREEARDAEVSGTPAFMAPEQFRGQPLDCRTDIYSLGATLYQALTGEPPFDGASTEAVVQQHLHREPQFPDATMGHLPARARKLMATMLAKLPDQRFNSYEELLNEVVAIRKQVARDESLIPSVHTISFSKYKLREELQDSPDQVFRRREEKKERLAKDKLRRADEATGMPRILRLLLIACLLAIAAILTGLIFMRLEQPRETTVFRGRAERLLRELSDNEAIYLNRHSMAEILERAQSILSTAPSRPEGEDLYAFFRLQAETIELRARLLEQSLKDLMVEQQTRVERQLEQVRQEREHSSTLLETLRQTIRDLEAERSQGTELVSVLEARMVEVEERLQEVNSVGRALSVRQQLLGRQVRGILHLRLSELFRQCRWQEALELLRPDPLDEQTLSDWRRARRLELAMAQQLLTPLINSGKTMAGTVYEEAQVLEINDAMVSLRGTDGDALRLVPLGNLPAKVVLTWAKPLWPGPEPVEPAAAALAGYWGDFELALSLLPEGEAKRQMDDLATLCFQLQHDEIRAIVYAGNMALAAAKARLFKQRYAWHAHYPRVHDEISNLMRTVPVARPPATLPPPSKP